MAGGAVAGCRPVSPGSNPKTSSIQLASGSAVNPAKSSGGAGSAMRCRSAVAALAAGSVIRSRVSPITWSGSTGSAEQGGRDLGDRLLLLLGAALGGHRRRRADALDVRRVADVPEPSHEERYVRALPAPVGVQLVQDEEPQALGRLDRPRSCGRVRTSSSIT